MPTPSSYTFRRHERLKSRKTIARVFKEAKAFHVPPVKMYYLPVAENGLLAGFVASARNFKKAVDRNRIKRLMREAYRQEKGVLGKVLENKATALAVFFVYTGRELPAHATITEAVQGTVRKLVKKLHEKDPANT